MVNARKVLLQVEAQETSFNSLGRVGRSCLVQINKILSLMLLQHCKMAVYSETNLFCLSGGKKK